MAKVSGQYTIQEGQTPERFLHPEDVKGNVIMVQNHGSNKVFLGGSQVNDDNGYSIRSQKETQILLTDVIYVYGPTDLTVEWIAANAY